MSSFKYIVPALAVAGRAVAQSTTSCAAASTFTIQNGGDASALASCTTFSGSIALATGIAGNIDISGVEMITGGFSGIGNGSDLTSLTAEDLQSVSGSFELAGLTGLTTLSMPRLNSAQTISLTALPVLQTLDMAVTMTDTLNIVNTGLTSLEGINLIEAQTIMIALNGHLNEINMPLVNVTKELSISTNGNQLVLSLPNLTEAGDLLVRNVTSASIPQLSKMSGSLGFYSSSFDSLSAPNLTSVKATLAFVSNNQLSNLSFPVLTTIGGGLQVANNSALDTIDGFPMLQDIYGAAVLTGEFKNVSFPALKEIQGAMTLASTEDISDDCTYFNKIQGAKSVVQGPLYCHPNDSSAAHAVNNITTGGTGTSSGSGSTPTPSHGAASTTFVMSSSAGVFGLLAVVFGLL